MAHVDEIFDVNRIFAGLEAGHHAMLAALSEKLKADAILERAEDAAYSLTRKGGVSIEDAKRSARSEPLVISRADDAIRAEIEYQKARGHYEHLKILAELRRTQETSLRAMRV
jgi:hypothetical protein